MRDTETFNDFFNARYYTAPLMRFLSPDPGNAGADPTDPQTWNAYAYVRNNPLALVDPSGMDPYNVGGCWFQTAAVTSTVGSYTSTSYETTILGCDFSTGDSYMQLTGSGFQNSTSSGNSGGGGVSSPAAQKPKNGNVFSCASEFASKYSAAGALQRFGIGTSGVGGFITNALGGNAFSGATDLIQSLGSGQAGGHSVFYNMGQGAAGPTQGFGAAFGKSIEGTPLASGPVDVATSALAAKGFSVATGAGQTIQTLNGAARLGSIGLDAGEFATGVGVVKLIYDAASYGVGLVHCY